MKLPDTTLRSAFWRSPTRPKQVPTDVSLSAQVNIIFLREGGNPDDYRAGIERLKADGMIDMHPSGTFFRFTEKGAQRFA